MPVVMQRAKSMAASRRLLGLLLGLPGSGKTWAGVSMPGPRLWVVCDPSAKTVIIPCDPGACVFEVASAADVREVAEALALRRVEGNFKSVIFDSLHYYQKMLRDEWFKDIPPDEDIPAKQLGRVTDETEMICKQIMASGLHTLLLCHTDERQEKIPGTKPPEKRTVIRPMLTGQGRVRIPGACNFVGYMTRQPAPGNKTVYRVRTTCPSDDMLLKALPGIPEYIDANLAALIDAAFGAAEEKAA